MQSTPYSEVCELFGYLSCYTTGAYCGSLALRNKAHSQAMMFGVINCLVQRTIDPIFEALGRECGDSAVAKRFVKALYIISIPLISKGIFHQLQSPMKLSKTNLVALYLPALIICRITQKILKIEA